MLSAYKKDTKDLIFAIKNIKGICPDCGEEMIPKCGSIIPPYWSHKSATNCDSKYSDGMSQWHINWQNTILNPIPGVNVEVYIDNLYRKRADLVCESGLIVEFQKSPMSLEERKLREKNYKNMIWVIHRDIESSKTWSKYKSDIPILTDYNIFLKDYYNLFDINRETFINRIINGKYYNKDMFKVIYDRLNGNGIEVDYTSSFSYFNNILEILDKNERERLENIRLAEKAELYREVRLIEENRRMEAIQYYKDHPDKSNNNIRNKKFLKFY